MNKKEIVITSAARTAVGSLGKTLKNIPSEELGASVISEAIKRSFQNNTNRVWVHTCSLDHKNALNNYISRGMKIFKTEILKI